MSGKRSSISLIAQRAGNRDKTLLQHLHLAIDSLRQPLFFLAVPAADTDDAAVRTVHIGTVGRVEQCLELIIFLMHNRLELVLVTAAGRWIVRPSSPFTVICRLPSSTVKRSVRTSSGLPSLSPVPSAFRRKCVAMSGSTISGVT